MIRIFSIFLLFFTLLNPAFAEITTVTVTGYGVNPELATQHAWKMAISQSVGTIVDSTVVVENDQLIKDEVLAFSKGFIDSFEVLETSSENGLVIVKIQAVVTTEQLESKLVEIGVHSIDVDGGSLGASLFTQLEEDAGCKSILSQANNDMLDLWSVELVGDPSLHLYEGNYLLSIPVKIYLKRDGYEDLSVNIRKSLEKVSVAKISGQSYIEHIVRYSQNPRRSYYKQNYKHSATFMDTVTKIGDSGGVPYIELKNEYKFFHVIHTLENNDPEKRTVQVDSYVVKSTCIPETRYGDPVDSKITLEGVTKSNKRLFFVEPHLSHLKLSTVDSNQVHSVSRGGLFTKVPEQFPKTSHQNVHVGFVGTNVLIPSFVSIDSYSKHMEISGMAGQDYYPFFDALNFSILVPLSESLQAELPKLDKVTVEFKMVHPNWYKKSVKPLYSY